MYTTQQLTYGPINAENIASNPRFPMPERFETIVSVLKNGVAIVGGVSFDSSHRYIEFTNPVDYTSAGNTITVTYTATRPLPQNGEQLTIYYQTRAPQAVRSTFLGTSLTVTPRKIGQQLLTASVGSGSPDEAYPYPYLYVQLGGIYPSSGGTFNGEHEFSASAEIAVGTFSAATGLLNVPTHIGYVPSPEAVTFQRSTGDTDIEGRSFFKSVPGGYIPNAYGPPLSDAKRHRVVLPMVAELTTDSVLGRKGQLVLVLLVRYATFDALNSVSFNTNLALNTTVASVFKIKGNPLVRRP
jgi:hypothetical protein